eukprot:jgi/Ulvmu1/2778/UM140_0007.1
MSGVPAERLTLLTGMTASDAQGIVQAASVAPVVVHWLRQASGCTITSGDQHVDFVLSDQRNQECPRTEPSCEGARTNSCSPSRIKARSRSQVQFQSTKCGIGKPGAQSVRKFASDENAVCSHASVYRRAPVAVFPTAHDAQRTGRTKSEPANPVHATNASNVPDTSADPSSILRRGPRATFGTALRACTATAQENRSAKQKRSVLTPSGHEAMPSHHQPGEQHSDVDKQGAAESQSHALDTRDPGTSDANKAAQASLCVLKPKLALSMGSNTSKPGGQASSPESCAPGRTASSPQALATPADTQGCPSADVSLHLHSQLPRHRHAVFGSEVRWKEPTASDPPTSASPTSANTAHHAIGEAAPSWSRFRSPCATIAPPPIHPARGLRTASPPRSPPPPLHPNISYTRPNAPTASFGRRPRRRGPVTDSASSFTSPRRPGPHNAPAPVATEPPRVQAAPATCSVHSPSHSSRSRSPIGSITRSSRSPTRQPGTAGGHSPPGSACCARVPTPPARASTANPHSSSGMRDSKHDAACMHSVPRATCPMDTSQARLPGPGSYDDSMAALRSSRARTAPAARFGGPVSGGAGKRTASVRRSFGGDSVTSVELREPARAQDRLGKRAPAAVRWARPGSGSGKRRSAASNATEPLAQLAPRYAAVQRRAKGGAWAPPPQAAAQSPRSKGMAMGKPVAAAAAAVPHAAARHTLASAPSTPAKPAAPQHAPCIAPPERPRRAEVLQRSERGVDVVRPRHPAWTFKPIAATQSRATTSSSVLLDVDTNQYRAALALKPRSRTGFVKFSASCSSARSTAYAACDEALYTPYNALQAWEALQGRVPVVAMALASDRWPGGITGTLCMHPDALDAIILDVDAAWRAMRAAPRAALIPPLPQAMRRVAAPEVVGSEGVVGAWRAVRRRTAVALPFEVGGRRGGGVGAGGGTAPLVEYNVRFDLVEPRVLGMDFSKGQGHPVVIEEVSSDAADPWPQDGARLRLEVAAAKDSTLPRHHPGLVFQPADAGAASAEQRPGVTRADLPLPDPHSDMYLRRRLPTVHLAAPARPSEAVAADSGAEAAAPSMHAAAVEEARRAALRGPGSYNPPLWLQLAATGVGAPRFALTTGRGKPVKRGPPAESTGGAQVPDATAGSADGEPEPQPGDVLDLLPCYDLVRRAVRCVQILPEGSSSGSGPWSAERVEQARRCVELELCQPARLPLNATRRRAARMPLMRLQLGRAPPASTADCAAEQELDPATAAAAQQLLSQRPAAPVRGAFVSFARQTDRPEPKPPASAALPDLNIHTADGLVYPTASSAPSMANQLSPSRGKNASVCAEDDDAIDWRDYRADWAAVRPAAIGALPFGDGEHLDTVGNSHRTQRTLAGNDVHADLDAGCYAIRWASVRASAPAFSFAHALRMQPRPNRGGDTLQLQPTSVDDIGVAYQATVASSAFASRAPRFPKEADCEGDALVLETWAQDALASSTRATRPSAPNFAVKRHSGLADMGARAVPLRQLDYDSDDEVHTHAAGFGARAAKRFGHRDSQLPDIARPLLQRVPEPGTIESITGAMAHLREPAAEHNPAVGAGGGGQEGTRSGQRRELQLRMQGRAQQLKQAAEPSAWKKEPQRLSDARIYLQGHVRRAVGPQCRRTTAEALLARLGK